MGANIRDLSKQSHCDLREVCDGFVEVRFFCFLSLVSLETKTVESARAYVCGRK